MWPRTRISTAPPRRLRAGYRGHYRFYRASAGRRPDVILGKPYAGIVEEALKLTGLTKHELAMVGDRLYTDIATGLNFGILSILVLTGEASEADVAATGVQPDLIFERLSAMNPYLEPGKDTKR